MRLLTKISLMIIFIITITYCSCSDKNKRNSERTSAAPRFNDNGNTIDSLKSAYSFETVEYENWEDDDTIDSSLTVCFINSKKVLHADFDARLTEFKAIAASLRKSVAEPNLYNSYYIIFVKRDTTNGIVSESHTAGMDKSVKEL